MNAIRNSASANYHLKSNMDRFIACEVYLHQVECFYLKSNMDRFIVKN